jgi:methylenetetrahydrofolate dehydrogenase (NADP+)/methenyltetrahydrofolate cyclohydrolase
MEVETFQYTNNKGWSVDSFPKLDSENTLILVFADPDYINNPSPLKELSRHYPKSKIIGCSSSEEIIGSFILGNTIPLVSIADHIIVVSAIHFQNTTMKTFISEIDGGHFNGDGKEIIKQLNDYNLKGIFVVSDCDKTKFKSMIKGLSFDKNDQLPRFICDLASNATSWVIIDGKIKKNAIIALGFYGEDFHMEDSTNYNSDNKNTILAISQQNHFSDENELEDTLTFLPKQTKLIGFYSADDSNIAFLPNHKKSSFTILYEEKMHKIKDGIKLNNSLEGKLIAKKILKNIKNKTISLKRSKNFVPKLATIYLENNTLSLVYLNNIRKSCQEVGIDLDCFPIETNIQEKRLIALIKKLNKDEQTDAIQLILPLPKAIHINRIAESISIEKDVDCIHPYNLGKFIRKKAFSQPCLTRAIMLLLESLNEKLEEKHAVIVGASNAGIPIAIALKNAKCTVSICDIHTLALDHFVRQADILVSATGKIHLIQGEWIKPEALVIDAGIGILPDGTIQGDVVFDVARQNAKWISPVLNGVGPITIAILLQQTLDGALKNRCF